MEESGLVEGGQATLPRDGRGVLAPDGIKRRTGLVDHGPRESISMTFCHSARLYALRSEYNLATCEALGDRSRQHDEQRDTVGNTHRDSLRCIMARHVLRSSPIGKVLCEHVADDGVIMINQSCLNYSPVRMSICSMKWIAPCMVLVRYRARICFCSGLGQGSRMVFGS
ncbi:uncharacterized protein LOC112340481 [Selaginella moellendorffii]|uniref:uncharacterized protein LOC112340481 n=1 Tax=Selaginella moellendorffii TaxID=88036 RepID=UPI000D1D0705|nr:uncharacterized protein LOC112340481 [Selaginella moellendorffii]|eukprot:XP_024542366.1 uncharacterized protein LOC112340481 [Selaginella moellendorffii]